jgi:hypothetical protein
MGSYLKAETSFKKSVSEDFSERQPKMLKTISAYTERTLLKIFFSSQSLFKLITHVISHGSGVSE